MAKKLPEPQVIFNEEIHVFIPVGPGRYQHYIRDITGRRMFGAERLAEDHTYTLEEAQVWVASHNPLPIGYAEVTAVKEFNPESDQGLINEVR